MEESKDNKVRVKDAKCTKDVHFRLTEKELETFRAYVAASGVSATEYFLRQCVYGGLPRWKAPDTEVLRRANEEIARQGNNLNQIAHALNTVNRMLRLSSSLISPRRLSQMVDEVTEAARYATSERAEYSKAVRSIMREMSWEREY